MSIKLLQSMSTSFVEDIRLSTDEKVIVRGLFTTDILDRERDFVDPMSFKLTTFENTRTLLRNHQFIKDSQGNKYAAGHVTKLVPIIIEKENPENKEEWVLKSLLDSEIKIMWPKRKSPNLLVGDKGIHVVAEVTHPEVVKQVKEGSLGAFSWTGLSKPVQRQNKTRELTEIDLIEISLVNTPANPDATFMVVDENHPTVKMDANLDNFKVLGMGFNREQHELNNVMKFTKSYTHASDISSDEDNYYCSLGNMNLVEVLNKSTRLELGGMVLYLEPLEDEEYEESTLTSGADKPNKLMENNMQEESQTKVEAEKFYLVDIETLKSRIPDAVVSLQKSTTIGDLPVEFHFIELANAEESEVSTKSEAVVLEAPVEETVAEELPVEEVAMEETPAQELVLEETTSSMEDVLNAIQALSAKVDGLETANTTVVEEVVSEKDAEEVIEEETALEQVIEEATAEEAPAEEAVAEEAVVEEVGAEEVVAEEAPVEEAVAEEIVAEEAVAEEAVAEEAVVEEVVAEEAPAEKEVVEEAVAEEAIVEEQLQEAIAKAVAKLTSEFENKVATLEAQKTKSEEEKAALQKSLSKIEAFENAVPPQTTREETITSTKSVESNDITCVDFFANTIMKGI